MVKENRVHAEKKPRKPRQPRDPDLLGRRDFPATLQGSIAWTDYRIEQLHKRRAQLVSKARAERDALAAKLQHLDTLVEK